MSASVPSPGLEVVPAHGDLETVSRAAVYPDQGLQYVSSSLRDVQKSVEYEKPWVCGLKRTTFWILVAAAIIIISAGALGGGLGGGLSRGRETTTSSQKASEQSPSASSVSSTGAVVSQTASATATISAVVGTISGTATTLYRDCPSSNDTMYNIEYNSTTYKFRKLCNIQAVINGDHATYVNQATSTLNDCINLCAAYNENNVTNASGNQVCSSVCWRNGFVNDDWPGQCFGYAGNNDSYSGGFNLQADVTCDSAIWINDT